jgi:radical SAM protein with 4Fe4S-binding SPASM domain
VQDEKVAILRAMSAYRIMNTIKLYSSFWVSRLIKKPIVWGYPVALSIEPTTACNLGCPECPSGLKQFTRPTGNLKLTTNQRIIDELKKEVAYINFYFQGEPFINKQIFDAIRYATDRKIYTSTSTNAHFLDDITCQKIIETGLKRLIISIDGTTQEVYEQYRIGGSLDKVIEGTKNIIKWKKECKSAFPHIVFQFLVVKPNEHQIEEVKKLAKDLGVDELKFKTAQVYDYQHGNPLIPDNESFARYRKNSKGEFELKNKMRNHCWRMWSSAVITWDGGVVPCCFDKDAKHQLGNIQFVPFKQLWKSNLYNGFRKNVLTNRQGIDICTNCSEGSKVFT